MKQLTKYKIDILITSLLIAIPFAIYTGFYISIIHDLAFSSSRVIYGILISYVYTVGLLNLILLIIKKFKNLLIIIISMMSIYFYINYTVLSNLGYSIQLEHFQLVINTGISEFISQSGIDEREVIQLFLYSFGVFLLSYFVITKIINYFEYETKRVPLMLIFSILLIDIALSYYKIKKYDSSVFNDTYTEAIIFRPNLAKLFIKDDLNMKPYIKKRTNTKIDVKLSSEKQPPHIVIFMAESLRADMTTKDIMPNLNTLEGTIFKTNYSASNATFFSVFSVLYGLFPTYYHDSIKQAKPTILSIVDNLNYYKSIYNTLSLSYAGLNDFLGDKYFDKHYENIGKSRQTLHIQDQENINEFKNNFIKSGKPEFHFIMTNSTHHNYYFPRNKTFEKFNPYLKKNISLLKVDKQAYKTVVFNKYKNATYYLDSLVKQVTDTIKEKKQWDNTIFVFFGDHGEEFFEDGHLLHANSLNYYQTSGALFIHAPSNKKRLIQNKTTSHIDIVPTIISILENNGVNIEQPKWLKGKDILSPLYLDRAVFSQQISISKKVKVSIANGKTVFIPKQTEKNKERKKLIDKYMKDLLEY